MGKEGLGQELCRIRSFHDVEGQGFANVAVLLVNGEFAPDIHILLASPFMITCTKQVRLYWPFLGG